MSKDEFVCLSVCLSRHHAHISVCISFKIHIQALSDTRKVFFANRPTHASFPNQHNYAKTNSKRHFDPLISLLLATSFDHACFTVATPSISNSVVSVLALYDAGWGIKSHLPSPFFFLFFFPLFNLVEAGYLLLVLPHIWYLTHAPAAYMSRVTAFL